ncbi:TrkA C-terminal domain-containing protein [Clostridium sp. LIBA-8841]|uniref:TrkA C-terminal domain-containing protein n=1 Tax=Clostridium sp. LIBA-8841 TaxID=2987530 RepID=UPI002AC44A9B|nr:TrkA C-terminal domain-containing protein [Clostridium sp. LIBA-8841]MDZ5255042.1 GntR family transcriptional regulator [Clostridium sp. LIBA-8841]
MESKVNEPIYKQIALDIAGRIYNDDMKIGEKIHGRSTLASNYNVSPETVRKAVKLLEDMKVVSSSKGSGVTIISKDNAYNFINRFHSIESVTSLKHDIDSLMREKETIEKNIGEMIERIVDYSNRLRYTNPLTPIEIELPKECDLIGKSVSESKFWQNTKATIVAIRRNGELIISPGPYLVFEKGDNLLVVGEEDILKKIEKFLKK